jgi:hypothetical protein
MHCKPHPLKHHRPYERRHSVFFYAMSNVVSHLRRQMAKWRTSHAERVNEGRPEDRDRLELGKSHGI